MLNNPVERKKSRKERKGKRRRKEKGRKKLQSHYIILYGQGKIGHACKKKKEEEKEGVLARQGNAQRNATQRMEVLSFFFNFPRE